MKSFYKLNIIFLFLSIVVQAQEVGVSKQSLTDASIRSLKIGDQVPTILMAKIINYKSKQANTNDFKNQLLILDFWDTYCGSCIEALPKLDSLQRIFSSKITIMPVTYQPEALVRNFFQTNPNVKNLQLPCVVEDKVLRSHFKHRLISHEVWIYKGVVKAITGTEYVTATNIHKILNGERLNWPIKDDDFQFDAKKNLFSLNQESKFQKQNQLFNSYSALAGYRSGIDYKEGITYDSLTHRIYFYNQSIVGAYTKVLTSIERKNFFVGPNRVILEVRDTSKYLYNKSGFEQEWKEKNQFCYEMVSTVARDKRQFLKMLVDDLNNKLGLYGRFEKRLMKCLVLVKKGSDALVDRLPEEQGGMSISTIAFLELDAKRKYPPTVDETGFNGSIKLKAFDGSLEGLRKEMKRQGFDIIEVEREIEMLVITETKNNIN